MHHIHTIISHTTITYSNTNKTYSPCTSCNTNCHIATNNFKQTSSISQSPQHTIASTFSYPPNPFCHPTFNLLYNNLLFIPYCPSQFLPYLSSRKERYGPRRAYRKYNARKNAKQKDHAPGGPPIEKRMPVNSQNKKPRPRRSPVAERGW